MHLLTWWGRDFVLDDCTGIMYRAWCGSVSSFVRGIILFRRKEPLRTASVQQRIGRRTLLDDGVLR